MSVELSSRANDDITVELQCVTARAETEQWESPVIRDGRQRTNHKQKRTMLS
jgi:hypothetical protein